MVWLDHYYYYFETPFCYGTTFNFSHSLTQSTSRSVSLYAESKLPLKSANFAASHLTLNCYKIFSRYGDLTLVSRIHVYTDHTLAPVVTTSQDTHRDTGEISDGYQPVSGRQWSSSSGSSLAGTGCPQINTSGWLIWSCWTLHHFWDILQQSVAPSGATWLTESQYYYFTIWHNTSSHSHWHLHMPIWNFFVEWAISLQIYWLLLQTKHYIWVWAYQISVKVHFS